MAISDQISRLQSSKSSIKSSIEGKGVSVPTDAKLDAYNTYIDQIKTQGLYESKQVTPTAEGSIVLPSEGYDALSQVIIDGDMNLAPANIKKDVNIFGVTGTLEAKANLQTKQVTPTASGTTVTADEGYDGLSEVNGLGDSNLISSNIKKDVSIFGVNGSYEGSGGGSTDYNVYVQNSEPTSKNGVWIKGSSYSGKTYFSPTIAKQGTFLDGNFSFMNQNAEIRGQVIVGKYMYVFGNSSSTSYRYDLENNIITSINAPTYSNYSDVGINNAIYCEKRNSIYLGYIAINYKNYFRICEYDIATNTWSQMCEIEGGHSGASFVYMHLYDDKLCVYEYNSNYTGDIKKISIDIDTKEKTNSTGGVFPSTSSYYPYYAVGKYLYLSDQFNGLLSTTENISIKKYDVSANTLEETKTFSNIFKAYLGSSASTRYYIAILGDKVYIFFYSNANRRLIGGRFDWNTGEGEVILSDIYMPNSMHPNTKYWRALIPTITTDRVYWHYPNFDTWAFQMAENNTEGLTNNSALIIQDLSGLHTTTIEDSARLTIGIKDAYIVNSNNLESKTTFYGDGEKWILLKNPTGETATVTFNTNGGSTIPSEQVVIGQKISAPSTPSKAGYVFDDWYLNGEPFDFSRPIVEDITLVAGWETYEVIDYIESSGTQYIDTGVKTGLNIKVEAEFACLGTSDDLNYSGAVYSGSLGWIVTGSYAQGYLCSYFCDSSRNGATIPFDNNFHTYLCSNGLQKIDDTQTNITATSMPTTLNLFIFKGNVDFSATFSIKQRVKYYKIYDNGTLVRNFIPIKTEKGAVGLLDQVSNIAYYNVGTGSFTGGKLQEPVQLSYIESTGTQYIDTGFTHNQNTKLEIKTSFNNIDQIEAIVNSSNNNSPYNNFNLFKINNEYRTDYAESFKSIPEVTFSINTPYIFLQDKNKSYVDGTLVATHPTATFTGSYPIRLLAKTSDGAKQMRGKVYYCKIWDNETLVRDFVPWKDEFGIICLHDNVENKNYYNQGTGTFIAGNGV